MKKEKKKKHSKKDKKNLSSSSSSEDEEQKEYDLLFEDQIDFITSEIMKNTLPQVLNQRKQEEEETETWKNQNKFFLCVITNSNLSYNFSS